MSPVGIPEEISESSSPARGLSQVERSSPRSDKVEYEIPTQEQNNCWIVKYRIFANADGFSLTCRASYSELDVGSSPGIFSTVLENLSNPTGSGYTANSPVNLDYFQFSVNCSGRSNELCSTPNARTRAATMTAMQVYSSGGNRTSNGVAYTDPRPSFESKNARQYNDSGDTDYIPPEVELPSYQELMDPIASGVDINTRFSSVEEANNSCRKSFDIPHDPTIPYAIEQKRAIVRALCKAMKSVDRAEDNPGMVRPFAERKYSDTRIEIACWNILVSSQL